MVFVAQEQFGKSVAGPKCSRYVTLTSSGRSAPDGKNIARNVYRLALLLVSAFSKVLIRISHVGAFAGQLQLPAQCAHAMHTRNTSRALHHIAVELSIVLAERTEQCSAAQASAAL